MIADQRLMNLLGGVELTTLRRRLRQRFERAQIEGAVSSFRIDRLNGTEYEALARLQGMPARRGGSILVAVASIDMALRNAGVAHSLKEALEKIDGQIVHIPTVRHRIATQWSQAVSSCTHAGLAAFLDTGPGMTLLKRVSKQMPGTAAELIQRASAVLQRLPASGLPRALLAAETLGDPHALDKGEPVATLVLAVWRGISEQSRENAKEAPAHDQSIRDTWAMAGILVNELARPALFMNLPTDGGMFAAGDAGEPNYLSLRTLLRTPPRWSVAGHDVFVCENPNLLAIVADRLGPQSAPLVCTDGMPSAAQQVLLSQLTKAGAYLHYHGDFDWPGLSIGNHVLQAYDASPWRFGAAEYIAAVQAAPSLRRRLKGRNVEASWDTALATAMREHQLLISEENVVAQLIPDLKQAG